MGENVIFGSLIAVISSRERGGSKKREQSHVSDSIQIGGEVRTRQMTRSANGALRPSHRAAVAAADLEEVPRDCFAIRGGRPPGREARI